MSFAPPAWPSRSHMLLPSAHLPPTTQCNMAFDRVSLKGGRKGGGGMGSTVGLGLPLGALGGVAGFL